jgi:hypothetical protein
MNNQLQFRINSYLRLASLCDDTDPRKEEYLEKAESLLLEMEREEARKNPVLQKIRRECDIHLLEEIKKIFDADKDNQEEMTVSQFMEHYPQLSFTTPERVGLMLSCMGIEARRGVINGVQKRTRVLPKPKNRT